MLDTHIQFRTVQDVRAYALAQVTECTDEIYRLKLDARAALQTDEGWNLMQDALRQIEELTVRRAVWSQVLECVN